MVFKIQTSRKAGLNAFGNIRSVWRDNTQQVYVNEIALRDVREHARRLTAVSIQILAPECLLHQSSGNGLVRSRFVVCRELLRRE